MRCISPYKNYSIQVFEGEEELVVDSRGFGRTRVFKKAYVADFEHSGLLDHEIELALKSFTFSMIPEGVNPLSRISVYDTEALAERIPAKERVEFVAQVEERLRELQKLHPSDFIIVDTPKAPKPWPSYDEMDVEQIFKTQELVGVNPNVVWRYEQENAQREEVLERMSLLEAGETLPELEPTVEPKPSDRVAKVNA